MINMKQTLKWTEVLNKSKMKGTLIKNFPLFKAGVASVFIYQLYHKSGIQEGASVLFKLGAKTGLYKRLSPVCYENKIKCSYFLTTINKRIILNNQNLCKTIFLKGQIPIIIPKPKVVTVYQ